MQDGRFSTIRFNEWICVSAQYEKAIARLGRQVYQAYSRGLLEDYTAIEMCKEISETFAEARELREDLEEELERDALDGLNVEEAKKADEVRKLSQAQVTKRKFKLKMTKFLGRQSINRSLAAHRDRVRLLSRDLGLRALNCYPDETLLSVRGHKALCRLAEKLNDDADKKWQDIVAQNKVNGSGLSFHMILINFVGNFANFSKGTYVGKILMRWFKYNEDEEQEKLSKQYEGSNTEDALKAQMEEIEEPHLDVGREIDNMQQEYEETPEEWNLPGGDDDFEPASAPSIGGTPEMSAPPPPEPVVEKWEPEADTWDPDAAVDEDFLGAVADAPDFPVAEPEPPPPAPAPQVLRKRPEPEAEDWLNESQEETASAAPATPTLPQVGMASPLSAPTPPPQMSPPSPPPQMTPPQMSPPTPAAPAAADNDDWGWGGEDSSTQSNWGEPSPESPASAGSFAEPAQGTFAQTSPEPDPFAPTQAADPFAPAQTPDPFAPTQAADPFAPSSSPAEESFQPAPDPFHSPPQNPGVMQKPGGKRPPFVKAQKQEKPLGDWAPPAPAAPAASQATDGWGTSTDEDYGWGTSSSQPAAEPSFASAPTPAPEPAPEESKQLPVNAPGDDIRNIDLSLPDVGAPSPEQSNAEADPLLTLLKNKEPQIPVSPAPEELGDDLLPDFLKDRKEEEQSGEDSSFIPELPSFLENDDGPQLEIVPFGTSAGEADKTDNGESFIPEMPES